MLSNKSLAGLCALAFACSIALMLVFFEYKIAQKCYAGIDKDLKVVSIIPDDFLSIGIDTSEIESYDKIDFNNEKFRELTSALAPARLRLGGTMSERLIFTKDDLPQQVTCEFCHNKPIQHKHLCAALNKLCKLKIKPFFLMSAKRWNSVNEFCKATNTKLLFSVNVLLRNDNGWNEANAKELVNYSRHQKYDIDWQLGNEPNSFNHTFNVTISPEQLGKDFKKLRHLLNEHGYKDALLVGPDTTRPQPHRKECLNYMVEFLGNASQHINVRSWHQYYLNSRTATVEDFWSPKTFELLHKQIDTMKSHTDAYTAIPMWLTETSSSYGGGAKGLSDSYAGTPLWLDKLGLAAKNNITTVIRQSLYGGHYSLISESFEPHPDWWVSYLYKKVVGNKVFNISCHCTEYQRMYAHCTKKGYTDDASAITIYAINLQFAKARFVLNGTGLAGDNLEIDEYIISAPSNNRQTDIVLLNGWKLYYSNPPVLEPKRLKHGNRISMPPYSVGFWVVKNTTVNACK